MNKMAINNRYEFVMLFDVENGNPNGDPDAGNTPRIDPETGYGYITDVCIKRKIRNYVELLNSFPDSLPQSGKGYNILVKPDKSLNEKFSAAYDAEGLEHKKKGKDPNIVKTARDFMCKNYFDVRTFGAVMSTGDDPCGIVRGPIQINFSRSISPISIQEVTITRQARTTVDRTETGTTEIGKKSIIPYALYRCEGYISAALANNTTDLVEEDVDLLWNAIINMFEDDHSAARGKMCMRKLYVFKHNDVLGNCPSNIIFDKISVTQKDKAMPARKYSDYDVSVDMSFPNGVEFIEKL
jgi:CRISPR-associated protein Csd2